MDNLIVREHQNVVLGKCIGHAEGHLVMVVFAEVWIELHVIEEVMHPSHVPFVGEMQAAVLYASRYLRPRCGLLGNHDDTFVSSAHQGIQVFEELDGFEIFIFRRSCSAPTGPALFRSRDTASKQQHRHGDRLRGTLLPNKAHLPA